MSENEIKQENVELKKETIKSASENYEPKFKKITDFEKISVELAIYEEETNFGTEKEPSLKMVKYTDIEGLKIRVPDQVLKGLKAQLKEDKDLQFFKVNSEGQGFNTEYYVIPLK